MHRFSPKKILSTKLLALEGGSEEICDFLCSELEQGLSETLNMQTPVKAGFIKIAIESTWADCPQAALEGAASAAIKSKALMEIHTEKGALAEKACIYFTDLGLLPSQLVLCHMDKRPDFGLQKELARLGVLLEYDTFYRPKYNPSENLWPLIEHMVNCRVIRSDCARNRYGRVRTLSLYWGRRRSGKFAWRDSESIK